MIEFIVIGAQRSGTTSLRAFIESHPQLLLSRSKEAPFFSDEAAYRGGLAAFERREFPRRADRRRGTVTPQYMIGGPLDRPQHHDEAERATERVIPARIKATLPDVRLIALLRDPVERCLSHFRLNVWRGWERRTLSEMVAQSLSPEALDEARTHPAELTGCVTWGEYGRLLTPYFELFDRGRLLVELAADLESEPADLLARVFAHIGVDPGHRPAGLDRRHHASGETWVGGGLRRMATWRLILGGRRLPPTVPLWRRLTGGSGPSPQRLREISEPSAEILAALRSHYESDRKTLEGILGRSLPWPKS